MTETKEKFRAPRHTPPDSWAVMSEGDAQQWESLSREQQLRAFQDLFSHPDATTATDATVMQILEETRALHRSGQSQRGRGLPQRTSGAFIAVQSRRLMESA